MTMPMTVIAICAGGWLGLAIAAAITFAAIAHRHETTEREWGVHWPAVGHLPAKVTPHDDEHSARANAQVFADSGTQVVHRDVGPWTVDRDPPA